MILADKIINLRKKNGWSQEELAEKLNVTRQSVSKWEGAQSVPDLERILQMSRIFGVSTDYLLRDEIEDVEVAEVIEEAETVAVHKVSMEEANAFLQVKRETSKLIAVAILLCSLAVCPVLMLGAAQETGRLAMTEDAAGGIGICIMLLIIAPAVILFIFSGMKTRRFNYLDTERIETEYGVSGMVKERKAQHESAYIRGNILGASFCVLSAFPLFFGLIFTEDDFVMSIMLSFLLLLAGIGGMFFIRAGIVNASMDKLLQEGDYTKAKKREQAEQEKNPIGAIYWPIVTAMYLLYSFLTADWGRSWIIWPVAAVLFGAVMAIYNVIKGNMKKNENE